MANFESKFTKVGKSRLNDINQRFPYVAEAYWKRLSCGDYVALFIEINEEKEVHKDYVIYTGGFPPWDIRSIDHRIIPVSPISFSDLREFFAEAKWVYLNGIQGD